MELTTRKWPVSALTLKWIAIATMFIDHAGYVIGYPLFGWTGRYLLLRRIGRIAFPIFAFLLIEGFRHTRNRWLYLRNLLIFAVVSEIPYDLALTGWERRNTSQNIYWALCLGLLSMIAAEALERWCDRRPFARYLKLPCVLLSLFVILLASDWLRVDYGFWGVLITILIYWGERGAAVLSNGKLPPQTARNLGAAAGIILWMVLYDISHGWLNELYGLITVVPILLYNGGRGNYRLPKWFFYAFYPVHLFLLYLVRDTALRWLLAG